MIRLLLFTMAAVLFNACGGHNEDQLGHVVEKVRDQYAPDGRVALYNVEYEKLGNKIVFRGETNLPEAKKELFQVCEARGLVYEDAVDVLPTADLGDEQYAVFNVSVANFRAEHRHSSEMVTQYLLGHAAKLYKKSSYWYYAQGPDHYLGWVEGGSITRMTKEQWQTWIDAEKVIYTEEYGHSYQDADENSLHVSDLVIHNLLKKIATKGEFIEVEYPDGRIAYLKANECADFDSWKNSRSEEKAKIILTAKRFFGVPYLWGGTSAKGMDCSGFTRTVFFEHGFLLPRDASQQVFLGETVTEDVNALDRLLPGDLLYFGSPATPEKEERITHVAIYLGGSRFIHESSYVHIQSLDPDHDDYSKYRHDSFMYGKRILPGKELAADALIIKNPRY